MVEPKTSTVIGRAERIILLDLDNAVIPAKIDTGADVSSIWASGIKEEDGKLFFKLFGPSSAYYTGKELSLKNGQYALTKIVNSFGDRQTRYVVMLRVKLADRSVKASFTLSNRSRKKYPILVGRRLLQGKFIVDVRKGEKIDQEVKAKFKKMHPKIKSSNAKLKRS